jgi:hypothetical protein
LIRGVRREPTFTIGDIQLATAYRGVKAGHADSAVVTPADRTHAGTSNAPAWADTIRSMAASPAIGTAIVVIAGAAKASSHDHCLRPAQCVEFTYAPTSDHRVGAGAGRHAAR